MTLSDDQHLLLSIKDTLDPTGRLNWGEDVPLRQWQGVIWDNADQRVVTLSLGENPIIHDIPRLPPLLTGTIPPELGKLTELQYLLLGCSGWAGRNVRFGRNRLTGPIPKELGNLSKLKELDLSQNELTGPIPKELGNLSKLQFLFLDRNRLTGSIPPELGNLTNLKCLTLYHNPGLTDRIPPQALVDLPTLNYWL